MRKVVFVLKEQVPRGNLPTLKKLSCVNVLWAILSHYWEVGSTIIGVWGSIWKRRTVTKAMLGRLSSNPNVLVHLSEATISEATFLRQLDLWTKGWPLKHPILNDCACASDSISVYLSFHILGLSNRFKIKHTFLSCILLSYI